MNTLSYLFLALNIYGFGFSEIQNSGPNIVNIELINTDTLSYDNGEFYSVIEIPNKSKDELFKKSKEWIYRTYKSGDAVIDIADAETSKINAQGITQSVIYKNTLAKVDGGKFKYYLTIFAKDGKVKILFDNITHLKGGMVQMSDGSRFTDDFPSTWGKMGKSQSAKQWPLMKKQAAVEFNLILKSFEDFLTKEDKHSDF
ncbi:hypothetical protein SMI01S_12110 [Sphingobacterium mizutaii NBRC 14946 = DSM 11724]|uniref:DUF4468 domain-containing protein n=2 Tax=Sphingobacterium mizutaii TaxID=1010 RepID=A0AAJ5C0X6_9SPHI|nr:DUF4468 domain-containing protein [Sphingobacterium mizutaii]GEM67605.1 hypothetical protein SMI01S_12110 [Sphingobacterium mizutaii NBRC 14946 = DSM 11724]SDL15137.1 protein of unknown function [Sphingobacterium mizutaii]SNV52321.1 Uncharacterised protein [Sphingobacterium mizutaii]